MTANGIPQQPPSEVDVTSLPSGSDAGDLNALLVKAEAIRAILAAGVPLDAATLAALETVTVGGTVELGPTALAAIGAIDGGGGPGAGGATEATLQDVADTLASILTQDTTTATKAEAIRLLLAGTIAVSASSLPLPTGAATQTTLAAILAAIVAGIPLDVASLAALESITVGGTVELGATSLAALESITATGPLTDTQLRASPVPVSGTFYPGTQPVSGTVTVANPTTNPETGLAKDATLAALADVVDDILTQDTTTATKAEAIRALLAATLAVAGNVGSAATDSGNPVKVGGKYNATLPTFTDGQRADLQLGSRGSENVTLMQKDTANAILSGSPSDTLANAQTFLGVLAVPHVWDGTQWVRTRGDATNGSDVDVTRVVPGTGATNLGKAEDGAHASGDTGLYILAVRQASLAPTSQADGRYESVQTDEVGQLKVTAGRILRSTATITRPADTTAYAASDEISSSTSAPAVVQFTGCEIGRAHV